MTRPGDSDDARGRVSRWWPALPAAAALLFAVLATHAAWLETPTVDEFAHVAAGCAYLEHGRFDLYGKNPPLQKLAMCLPPWLLLDLHVPEPGPERSGARPWLYGARFQRANPETYLTIFRMARAPTIALALASAALLWLWARSLFGTPAASVATALFLQSPTLLAHGHLATVDVGCTFTLFATLYLLRRAGRRPSWRRSAALGAVYGVALLTKFTAVLLAPVLLLLLPQQRPKRTQRLADLAIVAGLALLVVNLGMGFQGSFRRLGDFPLVSGFGRGLQAVLPAALPVPLPAEWWIGFDAQKRDTEGGQFGSYLLGEWSDHGWWYYDLVALAVKVPLPILAMLAASPFFLWRRRLPRGELMAIAVPIVVLTFFMSAFNVLNIGIRYLLPIFPLLFLLVASVWVDVGRPPAAVAAGIALLYLVGSNLAVHPDYLGYFNRLAGGPAHGHEILLDSNVDWGQDLYRLPAALEELGYRGRVGLLYFGMVDPHLYDLDYFLLPRHPVRAVLAVSVNFLQGYNHYARAPNGQLVWIERGHADWLRGREPVAKLGSIWLFDTRGGEPRAAPGSPRR